MNKQNVRRNSVISLFKIMKHNNLSFFSHFITWRIRNKCKRKLLNNIRTKHEMAITKTKIFPKDISKA